MKKQHFLFSVLMALCAMTATTLFTSCSSDSGRVQPHDPPATANMRCTLLTDDATLVNFDFYVKWYDANGEIKEEKVVWDVELNREGYRKCQKNVTTKLPSTLGVYCYMKLKEGVTPQSKYTIGYGRDYTFYSATVGDVPISHDYKGDFSGPSEYDSDILNRPIVDVIYQYDADGKCTKGTWQ